MTHILAVDDDPAMRALLAEHLADQDFQVSTAADGQEMARVMAGGGVDLVIIDLKLGREDGIALMRGLRARSSVPIIVMTGHRRDEIDRVLGLELGADDYMVKPFSLRELTARVRAILRRNQLAREAHSDKDRSDYRFAGWQLDMRLRRLTSPVGDAVPLTRGEFGLLVAFLRAPRRVLTREQLLAASRVHGDEVFDRSIDVQILRLRRKLETDPSNPALIRTERGAGYVFEASVDVS